MTDTPHSEKAKAPLPQVLFFRPSAEERAMVERIAREEDRTLSTVTRRIFRAGLAAKGLDNGTPSPTA